ncbi:MAG: F0F1 ATP synthase subunit delta [Bacteroidales bacterium]|nr:F0F1 ATP synthase subunit delta [Bacteroidales bacterium]
MNTGAISTRYAKALLLLVRETGNGARMFDQVRSLLRDPGADPGKLEPELERLVLLLRRNRRLDYLRFVLHAFLDLWCRSEHIRLVRLSSCIPSPELERSVAELVAQRTGDRVVVESKVDPSLLGGFVYEVDGYMLNASVKSQIERIRRQFIEKNKRIV